MQNSVGPLALLALLLPGLALLWTVRLLYPQRTSGRDTPRLIMVQAAWIMILAALFGAVTQSLLYLAPVGWIILIIIVVSVASTYRSHERCALMWCITSAVERGIPVEVAARAFSTERPDETGLRAQIVADHLEAGMVLPDALRRAKTRLSTDVALAIRYGTETGNLAVAMQRIAGGRDELQLLLRSLLDRFLYLNCVVFVMGGMMIFAMGWVVPVFSRMFSEFDLELPRITLALVAVSEMVVSLLHWILLLVMLPLLLYALFRFVRWVSEGHNHLLSSRWWFRADVGLVMRALSLAVEQQRPIGKTVFMLARVHPVRAVGRKLNRAGDLINDGVHWCDSLYRAGLLRGSEAGLLRAAERVGNLSWCLDELGEGMQRRLIYRLRFWQGVVFPVVLLLIGTLIFFISVGLFMPLIQLIQALA